MVDLLRGDSDLAQEARSLYDTVVKGTDFDSVLMELQTPGTWQGTTTAVSICLLFEINVCIVSTTKNGFLVHNTKKWLILRERNFIEDLYPTVYLYHHLHRRLFKKSSVCNHFAFMYHIDLSNIGDSEIYGNEDLGLGRNLNDAIKVQDAEDEEPIKEPESNDTIQVQQQQQSNPRRCKSSTSEHSLPLITSTSAKQKKYWNFWVR